MFRVNPGGGRTRYEERKPDEQWESFRSRMNEFATGILKIATFMPFDSAGNDLLSDEPLEEHENA
jgi:hypothetical protein